MRRVPPRPFGLLVCFVLLTFLATVPAFAQGGGGSTSLSGVVVDTSGAVIPGADVLLKSDATGVTFNAVTSHLGTFTIPALPAGKYTATVTLSGFKTAVVPNIVLNTDTPGTIRVSLELGPLEETVVVQGGTEIVQTQASTISTTVDVKQITALPTNTRNALDFVTTLPGVNTPGTNRDSTVNGLPQSAINITLDGMSIQDNYLKSSDGFFTRLRPSLDAIEEVTFTSAAQGADSAGQGAAQIRFVTRSGTNQFRGSAYYYYRNDSLNANTWFNNRDLPPDPSTGKAPKPELMQHQPGFRIGGPIVIPALFDGHNKAFFFFNYEELYQPDKPSRDRIVLAPDALRGIFRYNATAGGQTVTREVNLLQLAAKNGQTSTIDPVIGQFLLDIQSATASSGGLAALADPNVQRYTYQFNRESHNRYPTARLDYNLSQNHRLSGTYSFNKIVATPDTTNNREPYFPGFPLTGIQDSDRYVIGGNLRSTLGPNMVNELRIGGSGGATLFSPNFTLDMWSGSVANTAGYHLNLNGACCGTGAALTNQGNTNAISSREASTKVVEDTLNWIRGSHSLSFGASWTQVDLWLKNRTMVPQVNFGVITGDPAEAMFSAANFPGASTTVLNNAKAIYAILVGRVQSMTATARINEETGEYEYLGEGVQRGRMREIGLHVQDSWRMRPNLTVNYGLRYELQLPFYSTNNSYSTADVEDVWGVSGVGNLFEPGVLDGRKPTFKQFKQGERAYQIDWNNLAPTLGFAWTTGGHGGALGKILGAQGDTVVRAGFALAYNRHGMSDFSDVFGANPGVSITTNRDQSLGNLGSLPLLFRNRDSRLTAPVFPVTPVYPMTDVVTGDVNIFDPYLQVPYAMSWQAGVQRKITGDLAVEARYVGTRHLQGWTEYNYNEINVVENGFLNEFKLAQQNLQANIANGRGANFRYYGPGTGTAPLPIMLAYFSGLGSSQAGDPSKYSSSSFASSTFVNTLAKYNPNPCCITSSSNPSFAYSLYNNSTFRANAIKAGLAANFFQVNPDLLGGANITSNGGYTTYDSLQLELRKRSLSGGFQFQTSYTYGKAYESRRYSFRTPRVKTLQSDTLGGVMHALKGSWVYELPFGRGKRFASGAGPTLQRLVGGWEFDGLVRWQSGQLMDFGNVRLEGMSVDQFKKLVKLRVGSDGQLYMLPQEIIDETVKAFSVSATSPTGYGALGAPSGRYLAPANSVDCLETVPGYGECGEQSLVVPGPPLVRFDLSIVKRTQIKGRVNFEFRAEMLNALNHPYFYPASGMTRYTSAASPSDGNTFGSNPDNYRITNPRTTPEIGREVQLVGRISW